MKVFVNFCKHLTKNVYPKSCIYWTEETINKLNKPPSNEESNSNRKENHTASLPIKPHFIKTEQLDKTRGKGKVNN